MTISINQLLQRALEAAVINQVAKLFSALVASANEQDFEAGLQCLIGAHAVAAQVIDANTSELLEKPGAFAPQAALA